MWAAEFAHPDSNMSMSCNFIKNTTYYLFANWALIVFVPIWSSIIIITTIWLIIIVLNRSHNDNRKGIVMMILIAVVFLISVAPFFVMIFIETIVKNKLNLPAALYKYNGLFIMTTIHLGNVTNFFIYYATVTSFRNFVQGTFWKRSAVNNVPQ